MTAEMSRLGRRVFTVVLIVGLAAALVYSLQVLLLIFAGILLAILLRTAGTWLAERTGLSMKWSMTIVLVAFATFFLGSIGMFGVQIVNQADRLFATVSEAYQQFQQKLAQYHVAGAFSGGGLSLETPAKAAASGVISVAAALILVLFLGTYLSAAPQLYTELFLDFFDQPVRRRVGRLLGDLASALRWWLAGQLMAMAVVGIIAGTGLLLIGVPMAVSLAVLAAILTFVPYIGAILSSIPAILIAFTVSGKTALYVVIVYAVAHIVEGYIIVPLIQHRLVYLPPAMILATQFLMELFGGIVGVTLATPLMVVGMVLIKKLYFKQEWDEPAEEKAA
jgi:predicted PurR-regulated permease PerM